jgi:hypothetical protein
MHVYDAFHAETEHIPVAASTASPTPSSPRPATTPCRPGHLHPARRRDRDQMILGRDVALAMNFGAEQRRRGGVRRQDRVPSTRMGLITQLRQTFLDVQDYIARRDAAAAKKDDKSDAKAGQQERRRDKEKSPSSAI